jgi:hypothetical protein
VRKPHVAKVDRRFSAASIQSKAAPRLPASSLPRVQAADLKTVEYVPGGWDSELDCFFYNVSEHLNPVVVASIMENPPSDASFTFGKYGGTGCGYSYSFDPHAHSKKFDMSPIILRSLRSWYEQNKASEYVWGAMPLYRPDARKISWVLKVSGGGGIPFGLKAVHGPESVPDDRTLIFDDPILVEKATEESTYLTLGDLLQRVEDVWNDWIESEQEEHDLSHDGLGCDLVRGIPGDFCLEFDKEDGEEEGQFASDEEEEAAEQRVRFRRKVALEEYIDRAVSRY